MSGSCALLLASFLATAGGRAPVAVVNALGAWAVRWLQAAAIQALDNPYPDATPGGVALALLLAALGGAVFGGVAQRAAGESPLAWGLFSGILLWAAGRWFLLPLYNPVLTRVLESLPLAVVCMTYGLGLGLWHDAGRRLRSPARRPTALP